MVVLYAPKNLLMHGSSKPSLTYTESKLYRNFLDNPWEIFSREDLLYVLGKEFDLFDEGIKGYIKRIRKKISTQVGEIISVHKRGYYFAQGNFSLDLANDPIEIEEGIHFIWSLSLLYVEGGRKIHLPFSESSILQKMLESPARIYPKSDLLAIISDESKLTEWNVSSHIKRLRKKLNEAKQGLGKRILAEYGMGYYWK